MIIREASVALAAQHSASAVTMRRERLRLRAGDQAVSVEVTAEAREGAGRLAATGPLGRLAAGARPPATPAPVAASTRSDRPRPREETDEDAALDYRTRVVKWVAEQLLGAKVRVVRLDLAGAAAVSREEAAAPAPTAAPAWSIEYERTDTYVEAERASFRAAGALETADGRRLAFELSLEMARQFRVDESLSFRAGAALTDPLVLNLDGRPAALTGARFAFDLDADGAAESVPTLRPGSAYLALDRDGDGRIGDGGELFGPTSGDGFAELAAHDDDGNGWIDGRDQIMGSLRLWAGDAAGESLQPLAAAGIGAIYLGRVATPFDLKDGANVTLGRVASTGLYVREGGQVGTVQQVDLAV